MSKPEASEFYNSTGLDEDDPSIIHMKDGNVYLALMPHKDDEQSCGAAILSTDGGSDMLQLLAWGMFELLSTEPELLMEAGYEFHAKMVAEEETDADTTLH